VHTKETAQADRRSGEGNFGAKLESTGDLVGGWVRQTSSNVFVFVVDVRLS